MHAKKSSKNFFDGPKISCRTFIVRGVEVMLDSDIARVFRTTTKRINEVVKRHKDQFSRDFVFRVGDVEFENLRSQIATSNSGYRHSRDEGEKSENEQQHPWEDRRGGRRHLPYVFTPLGMAELASVL